MICGYDARGAVVARVYPSLVVTTADGSRARLGFGTDVAFHHVPRHFAAGGFMQYSEDRRYSDFSLGGLFNHYPFAELPFFIGARLGWAFGKDKARSGFTSGLGYWTVGATAGYELVPIGKLFHLGAMADYRYGSADVFSDRVHAFALSFFLGFRR